MTDPEDWLKSNGWTFDKVCAKCQGGGIQYSKREYWVKLFNTRNGSKPEKQFFKLYHKGINTFTLPVFKLEETVKDI